ncbi:hypothetical protein [Pontibacter indicus]|uniref:hypothetical protein n=1 Tax=Pontibacter indicus TaxID=1317125 RepID=UPI00147C2374|nr:hypothetical protein [Pontibacter indicus]
MNGLAAALCLLGNEYKNQYNFLFQNSLLTEASEKILQNYGTAVTLSKTGPYNEYLWLKVESLKVWNVFRDIL